MNIREELFELQDIKYREFQIKLVPNIEPESIIGVRVPACRTLAKAIVKEGNYQDFLLALPHQYYDENMLHGLILSELKDYEDCVEKVDQFLPYVDNWAVCDIMSPKCFKKNKEKLLKQIRIWTSSSEVYTCRFGIEMLMSHFLDEDFEEDYLEIPAQIKSEEYYLNMMIAWFFATALAKQYDASLPYLLDQRLDMWTHNKTIQKARESYRISKEQKDYLKTLKRS